ncbi:hypothetical protein ACHAXT_011735 [Thalassiosira profunda]
MEASAYLEAAAEHADEHSKCVLVKPNNVKSRFWVHFMKYDGDAHPDKKTTARCSLCGKDISVKQGTGGLKNHLKFKHPEENAALFEGEEASLHAPSPMKVEGGAPALPARKKPRTAYTQVSERLASNQRGAEEHFMKMWALTRDQIRGIRKDLKEEEDEELVRELEADLAVLVKKKAEYAEALGFNAPELSNVQI